MSKNGMYTNSASGTLACVVSPMCCYSAGLNVYEDFNRTYQQSLVFESSLPHAPSNLP